MVATDDPDLRAVVLVSGVYDLAATYKATLPGIRRNIEREAGISVSAFAERSAMYHAENIQAETLILHGRLDDRVPVRQAEMFAAAVKRSGAVTSLKLFDCGHNIPLNKRREAIRLLYNRVFS